MAGLAPQAHCTGCDVDGDAIAWARTNLPDCRWELSDFAPPLPFAKDSFDLIYSISVFSHLDEPLQDGWLQELARVLHGDGLALLSVHGPHAFEEFRSGRVETGWCRPDAFARGELGADEFHFEPYLRTFWNRDQLPGVRAGYGLTFHGADYIRRHWSRYLEIVEIRKRAISAWQDLVVCRKRIG